MSAPAPAGARRARIVYHGHCFDGMSSAALLSRVLPALEGPLQIGYRGLDHQAGGSHVPEDVLDAELNAVVDFRYTASPRLHYYFDHHESGIVSERERAHFATLPAARKAFDTGYGSCCKLIADTARARHGLEFPELDALVQAADEIDAARFADAATAVELRSPALQLMTVIESHGDDAFLAPRIDALASGTSLEQVASEPAVQRLFAPLREAQLRMQDALARSGRPIGDVIVFDLVGSGSDRFNKFIPYYLFPSARYAVAVSAGPRRAKVSVGSNPWAARPNDHDIAAICARYGGGGHRAVGAVNLAPDQIERARAIAAEVAQLLCA